MVGDARSTPVRERPRLHRRGGPTSFPFLARTQTFRRPVAKTAYDCATVTVIRDGSALLLSDLAPEPVTIGDVVLVHENVPCGSDPEGRITATTIYLDTDYLLDQVFWLHSETIADRHAAREVANAACINPIQVVRLGETGLNRLTSPLDELVTLSTAGNCAGCFFRMQALLFLMADTLLPHLQAIPMPIPPAKRRHISPAPSWWRRFVAIRPEIREVEAAMRADIARPWPLTVLGQIAHLSGSQVSRVFVRTYGKTPLAYLTMLRVEEMTRLLRETGLTTETISRQVGWACREHAAEMFRRYVGVTPTEYRRNGPPTTRRG